MKLLFESSLLYQWWILSVPEYCACLDGSRDWKHNVEARELTKLS